MSKLINPVAATSEVDSLTPPNVRKLSDYFGAKVTRLIPGNRFFVAQDLNEFGYAERRCRLAPYSESLLISPPRGDPEFAKRVVCSGLVHSGTGSVVLPPLRDSKLHEALKQALPYIQFTDWREFDLALRDPNCQFYNPKIANHWFPCREIGGPNLAKGLFCDWLSLTYALSAAGYELRFQGSAFCVLKLEDGASASALRNNKHPDHFRRLVELSNFIGSAYFGTTTDGALALLPGPSVGALVTEVLKRAPNGAVLTIGPEGMLKIRTGYVAGGTSCTVEKESTGDGRDYYTVYRGVPGGRSVVELQDNGTAMINGQMIDLRNLPQWEDPVIGSRVSREGLLFARSSGVDGSLPNMSSRVSRFPILIKPDDERPGGFEVVTHQPGGDEVRVRAAGLNRTVGIGEYYTARSGDEVHLRSPGIEDQPSNVFSFLLPASATSNKLF